MTHCVFYFMVSLPRSFQEVLSVCFVDTWLRAKGRMKGGFEKRNDLTVLLFTKLIPLLPREKALRRFKGMEK